MATVPAHGGGSPQRGPDGTLLAAAAPVGDAYVVTGHEDGALRKWDTRRPGVPLVGWAGHHAPVTAMAVHGDKVVTGSLDGVVRVWDATSGMSIRCDGHASQISALALADDYILSASWDGTLRCWFPAT